MQKLNLLRLFAFAALPCLFVSPVIAQAQDIKTSPSSSITNPAGTGLDIFSGASAKTQPGTSPGKSASEILRGNGTCIGYKLGHGNVLPDTLSIHASGSTLRLNRDFWVDAASGTLIFASPVRASEGISVYYRYLEGAALAQAGTSMPGLQLSLGGNTQLGLVYGFTAGDGSGMDTSLYGLAMGSKFGAGGLSSYGGLAYFSHTQASSNITTSTPLATGKAAQANSPMAGVDHLITQNVKVQTGKLGFHADYQDIGKNFAGFQSLKANYANNKTVLDQLTALEGEKGVRRLGFGFNLNGDSKSKTPSGLALDWNKIEDGKGAIQQESLGYNSRNFHFNYASRAVSDQFALFKGLHDTDKGQWEHEKGMTSTALGFGLNFASNKKGEATSGLEFASQNFHDKSGTLSRQLIQFNNGGLGLTMLNQNADKDFKRMTDLSDADKTSLALDLYRQFDPNAKAAQVTANDKAQILKEAGLSRNGLRLDDKIGKTGAFFYSQTSVSETTAADPKAATPESKESLTRENLALETSQFALNYTARKTDSKFSRFADLADVEKNNLALDTRRMFDPDAKLEQVTQKDRDLLVKEVGIQRDNLRGKWVLGKGGKDGTFTFSQFKIRDTTAIQKPGDKGEGIEGALFGYTGKTFQLNYSSQTIADSFNRMADLSDLDRAHFAKAHGLSQQQLSGAWQINKATKISFASLQAGGTKDAVTNALAAAVKNNKDSSLAAKTAASGFSHTSFSLETKGLSFSANQGTTDREFTRAADLPLPDADKAQIAAERGMQRSDYTLHFAKIKGLTFDGSLYSAKDDKEQRGHDVNHINAQYLLGKNASLQYKLDGDLTLTQGIKSGAQHSLFALNQEIGKVFLLNLSRDENTTYDKDAEVQIVKSNSLHIELPKDKASSFNYETKRVAFQDGKYENTTNLVLHAKPSPTLTFNYTRSEIIRGNANDNSGTTDTDKTAVNAPSPDTTAAAPSENSDAFDFQWQATKQFAIVMGVTQKDTTDKKNGDTVSFGMQGMPFKNVTVAAKFDEVHNDAVNTKDVADFSISNSKPFDVGPIRDLTITARYASLNDQRKLQNETMTGKASWKIWKNEFLLDYGGLTKQNGEVTISRLYSFTTDPNPKKWFHGGFYYKVRTLVDGEEKLIRRFTADWKLSRRTNFVYTYGTLPEDDKGNILPQTKADITLKHSLRSNLGLEMYYRLGDDKTTKKLTRSLGFGLEGKLNNLTKLELAYSLDANGDGTVYDHSNHYHFLLDHQVDADHFLTLSTEIRSHDGKDLKDDIRANLDFRFVF